jgi:D-glycero-beta-D-manno-heptose-7-phosphate kinase
MTATDYPQAKKLLIIGDTIVDETWYVKVSRLSPEAPVPVASILSKNPIRSAGGAALAAAYSTKIKFPSLFITTTDTSTSKWLGDLEVPNINFISENHISKTRYIDKESNYHLLRVDNDDVSDQRIIAPDEIKTLLDHIDPLIKGVVVLDYRKGMLLNKATCQAIATFARQRNIPSYVDTRGDVTNFSGYNYLKLNEKEYVAACAALNINSRSKLGKALSLDNIIVTSGKNGATIENIDNGIINKHYPSIGSHEGTPDVTGCGDVFDINFCYYRFIEGLTANTSLRLSVEEATAFAYRPIGERLC